MRFLGVWIKLVFSMNAFLTVVVATGLPKAVATTTSLRQWLKTISFRRSKLFFFLKDATVNFAELVAAASAATSLAPAVSCNSVMNF
jgi:hypothetical protein